MLKAHDNECREALKEVLDKRSNEAPNPQDIRKLGLGELALNAIVSTIRSYNQPETWLSPPASRLHQFVSEITASMERLIDEEETDMVGTFWFNYNGRLFYVTGFTDEDAETYNFQLKASGSQSIERFRGDTLDMEEIESLAYSIVKTVRQGLFCEICDSICKECYYDIDVGGVCTLCRKHYNEPGCKDCGNPFGKLEEGLHPHCAKRRRIERVLEGLI